MNDATLTERLAQAKGQNFALRKELALARQRVALLHSALAHAVHRGHAFDPAGCAGCEDGKTALIVTEER